MHYTYAIIGASAAGISALNRLSQLDPQASIIIISQESEPPYNTCWLIGYCAQRRIASSLSIMPPISLHVTLKLATRVEKISPHALTFHDGSTVTFDRALIATGSAPVIPEIIKSISAEKLFFFHTLADANRLLSYLQTNVVRHATIIGAGLTGMECADMLGKKGIKITLVEKAGHVLPSFFSAQTAAPLHEQMHQLGINFHTTFNPEEVGDDHIVICAAGTRVNSALAQAAGIECIHDSISVNEFLQSSSPTLFAAGDVIVAPECETKTLVKTATWADAVMQGSYAAQAMVGQPMAYPGIKNRVRSSFFGLRMEWTGTQSVPILTRNG